MVPSHSAAESTCSCGHKSMFCHRLNAVRWCGGSPDTAAAYWEGFERALDVARRAVEEGRCVPTLEDFK